ncbi:Uncharacterised protein [Achromobacter xylosoxidans]|uniref:hypothetical protein n=1 Tax=Alcaligenes xylosoxydans xylosoxydans TaxID=85698 RepID=UPI0006C5B95D|nr:hypothetical protein [Achromobacter xylosoxidans]MCM2575063.1 hypothetical protein [Achromobacter xylosoxidans]CUI38167.1 Uncharacterised protein [Achromobacter xylosoxidans]
MASVRTLSRSFARGEISPELFGRVDLPQYQTGLATCLNFVVLPHGPAQNRAGFSFVRETKTSVRKARLIPFSFNTEQTFALEVGHEYVRFHTMGATLVDGGGLPYEVVTPYQERDLFDLHYVQSADVLTIVHPNYAPRELRRLGALNWALTAIQFIPTIVAPASVTATAHAGSGTANNVDHTYAVTSLAVDTLEESLISSASNTVSNDLFLQGSYNDVAWPTVAGATRYNVYKLSNGIWGYVGQSGGLTFRDNNITPDISQAAPTLANPFSGADNYPAAVSYFEQRRWFAGTRNKPQNVWATRSGTESNLASSIPTRDDDAIAFRIAAREVNTIRHIVPLSNLAVLTASAEWRVSPANSDVLTPATASPRPQSYNGANNVQPAVVNNNLLYAAARGGHVREMSYNWQANGYITADVSILAPHLFDYRTITDMAFSRAPHPILWCVSSSGELLGLTYVPEQQVQGWHRHSTKGGRFESVCTVAEGDEDALYAIISRTINGAQVRYVERQHTRLMPSQEDAFFVDSGLSYEGPPQTVFSNLDHLEGETVNVLADGAVLPPQVVVGGSVTLEHASRKVHIGLPIQADLITLPLAFDAQAMGQGRVKNVNFVWLRLNESSGVFAGPSFDKLEAANPEKLTQVKQRTDEPYGSPPRWISGEFKHMVKAAWTDGGQVFVRQTDPLPVTLVSMTIEAAIGG